MPRPKMPPFHKPHKKITPIQLNSDDQEVLAKMLGIEKDEERTKAMLTDVEKILKYYQVWFEEYDKGPTPGSKIKALEPLRRSAQHLFTGLMRMDESTKGRLYFYSLESENFALNDPEAQFQSDLITVESIIKRIEQTIKRLTPHKKQGKPKQNALRKTMAFLFFLFNTYAKDNKEPERRHFISYALDAANIDHPDPDDQRTKFDNLLKKGPF